MKRIAIYLSLLIVGIMPAMGQSLKQYSGRFKLFGNREGVAKYTYKDADDGTRIFHGDFRYSNKLDGNGEYGKNYYNLSSKNMLNMIMGNDKRAGYIIVKGQFKDNKQVGKWVWETFNETENGDVKRSTIMLTFNKDGILDGPASYMAYDMEDHYSFNIKNGELTSEPIPFVDEDISYRGEKVWHLEGTLQNGHLVGKYLYVTYPREENENEGVNIKAGQYNENGYPVGVWTEVRGTNPSEKVVAKYSDSGNQLCSYHIDETTGDKISDYFSAYKVKFTPWLYKNRKLFLMRDSRDLNWDDSMSGYGQSYY